MVDVMRAVAATAAVYAEAPVDVADAQMAPLARAAPRLQIRDSFPSVFGDLFSAFEIDGRETAVTIDSRPTN